MAVNDDGLRHLYEGMEEGITGGLLHRRETPGIVPPWLSAPPMVEQFGERLANSTVFEPFFDGMLDELRRGMEQIGILTEEARGHWDGVYETQEEMLAQARKATEDIVALKDAPEERNRIQETLNQMSLPEVIQERALAFLDSLGLFGADVQRRAVDVEVARRAQQTEQIEERSEEAVEEMLGSILRTLGVTDRVIARAAREEQVESIRRERSPYADVVDIGEVGPGDAPDPGDVPPAAAGPGSRGAKIAGAKAPTDADSFSFALPTSWEEGVRAGADFGTWREAATGIVGDRLDRWATGWGDINRPDGTMVNGQWQWADEAAGAAYEASMSRIGRVQGAVDAYGKGAGLSGAIGQALPTVGKAIGGAGLALGATQMITGAAEAQREANRPYTSTYGAGEMDAYGQRLQEWGFSNLEMIGTMRSAQASQLYQGVAQEGLRGDERDEALDFAVSNYRQWGMDVQTSMQFIKIATTEGIESLDAYREGLSAVAETAKESGNSIEQAHKAYLSAIRQAQGITSGSAVAGLAASVSGLATTREHTGLEGLDYMRTLQSESVIQMYAAEMGMDAGEVSAGIVSDDKQITGSLLQYSEDLFIEYATGGRQPSAQTQRLIQEINERTGGNPSNDDVTAVAAALEAERIYFFEELPSIAQDTLGYIPDRSTMRAMIAMHYLNSPEMDIMGTIGDIEEREVNATPQTGGLRMARSLSPFDRSDMWTARRDAMVGWGLEEFEEGQTSRHGTRVLGRGSEVYDATRQYFRDLNTEGSRRSANLESVFQHIGDLAAEDVESAKAWEDKDFVVTDADGNEKQIGVEDLPRYVEDLEMGRISEVTKDGRRVAIQDIVGFDPTGLRREEFEQRVKVEIEAKGPLKDVLTVNQVGGTDIENSRLNGVPPSPFPSGLNQLFGRGGP